MIRKAIPAPFKKGVNFTNWMEFLPAEAVNESLFTKKDFENVKKLGCDVVRIPIHFEQFCKEENNYIIPDKILGILDGIISISNELGLYVIFDFHNNTASGSFTPVDVEKILNPVWTQLATRYKDSSDYVVYELMNEPHDIEIPVWNEIIKRLVSLVRSIDKKHYIIAGGADWNSFKAMKTLPLFKEDKIIYNFHFYDPHTFTHQGAGWCHMERIVNIPFPYSKERMPDLPINPTEDEKDRFNRYPKEGTIKEIESFFNQYVDFSLERNSPIFCGEFGCYNKVANRKDRLCWYETVTSLLEEKGISRTSWDYYGGFGLFNKDLTPQAFHNKEFPKFPEDLDMDIVKALGLNTDL